MNFNSYAKSAGYDLYYGRTEYNNEEDYDGQWGIWDEPFLMNMTKEISKIKEPFLTTVFTLSSHNPYKVPKKYIEKKSNRAGNFKVAGFRWRKNFLGLAKIK